MAGVLLRLLSVLRQTEPCVDGLALEPILHCKEFDPWFQVSHPPPFCLWGTAKRMMWPLAQDHTCHHLLF